MTWLHPPVPPRPPQRSQLSPLFLVPSQKAPATARKAGSEEGRFRGLVCQQPARPLQLVQVGGAEAEFLVVESSRRARGQAHRCPPRPGGKLLRAAARVRGLRAGPRPGGPGGRNLALSDRAGPGLGLHPGDPAGVLLERDRPAALRQRRLGHRGTNRSHFHGAVGGSATLRAGSRSWTSRSAISSPAGCSTTERRCIWSRSTSTDAPRPRRPGQWTYHERRTLNEKAVMDGRQVS